MLKAELDKYIGKKVKIRIYDKGSIFEGVPLKGFLAHATKDDYTDEPFDEELKRKRLNYYKITAEEGDFYITYKKNGKSNKIDRICFPKECLLEIEPVNENDTDYSSER